MTAEADVSSLSVLARLKAETRPQHDELDAALDLTSGSITLDFYRQTLEGFYGFYRPLELGMRAVGGWDERGLDMQGRWKTPLLERDLRALGVDDLAALPVCTDLPPHGSVGAAFGCLYVLEGSTLGGQLINRSLQKTLAMTLDTGGCFFNGYGDRTGPMWQEFRVALEAFALRSGEGDDVVAAARATFSTLQTWMTAERPGA